MLNERLRGAKGGIGQAAAQAFRLIVRHVEMLLVEEALELVVVRLDLSLRSSTKEAMVFSELKRVEQHVQLRKRSRMRLGSPVLLAIVDCYTPIGQLLRCHSSL